MLENVEKVNGVYYLTEKKEDQSSNYLKVREKEERIYSDDVVLELPKMPNSHRYFQEWKVREKSTNRILEYLHSKNTSLKIFDLGCGNGWFSHQLSKIRGSEVYAVDINGLELEQAARVFDKPGLNFIYADISLSGSNLLEGFDLITLNSCFQYFQDADQTIEHLKNRLNIGGEIHILDSPFYKNSDLEAAKRRTRSYYEKLGVPDMADNYFHHNIESVQSFDVLYKPNKSVFSRLLGRKDSPFMWLRLIKKA